MISTVCLLGAKKQIPFCFSSSVNIICRFTYQILEANTFIKMNFPLLDIHISTFLWFFFFCSEESIPNLVMVLVWMFHFRVSLLRKILFLNGVVTPAVTSVHFSRGKTNHLNGNSVHTYFILWHVNTIVLGWFRARKELGSHKVSYHHLLALPELYLIYSFSDCIYWNIFIFKKDYSRLSELSQAPICLLLVCFSGMISVIIQFPNDSACYLNWFLRHMCRRGERAEDDRWLCRNPGTITVEEIRNAQGINWSEIFQGNWILQKILAYPLLLPPWFIVHNFLLVIYRSTYKQY